MNLLKKLTHLFVPKQPGEHAYWFLVKCNRCDEIIEARVNLGNDLSLNDDGNYFCRKVLIGSKQCYQPIEVALTFNLQRELLDKQIVGGQFVEG